VLEVRVLRPSSWRTTRCSPFYALLARRSAPAESSPPVRQSRGRSDDSARHGEVAARDGCECRSREVWPPPPRDLPPTLTLRRSQGSGWRQPPLQRGPQRRTPGIAERNIARHRLERECLQTRMRPRAGAASIPPRRCFSYEPPRRRTPIFPFPSSWRSLRLGERQSPSPGAAGSPPPPRVPSVPPGGRLRP